MIKTALKHAILELCIDNVFSEIIKNFPILEWKINAFSVGDCVQVQVYFQDTQKVFKKCRVVYKKKNDMLIESYDMERVLKLVLRNGILLNITVEIKDSYEDYFA